MARLTVFNSVSLDGCFTDAHGDMSWAHRGNDAEWNEFVSGNASGGGILLFGRVTYEMMHGFWTTPEAKQMMPAVADGMNRMKKAVVSRSMDKATWSNTTLIKDLVPGVRALKGGGEDIVILGSGSVVSQLTQARLVDEYQVVVIPVVIGKGRTMFEGVTEKLDLKRKSARTFGNGNVVLCYEPA